MGHDIRHLAVDNPPFIFASYRAYFGADPRNTSLSAVLRLSHYFEKNQA
jgi:hypothetical protein